MTTVKVSNLSKRFRLYSNPRDRFKEWIHPLKKKYHNEFWALKDVSFSISAGETCGIIGRNGSGKSTLLQIITNVMAPTSGLAEINGRVSALLELGTGFDGELTGRENVFLNGSILGLDPKEIRERIPLIRSFADIGDFFDQPVKLYSSGMFVRLAFSAAIHVDPDIIIIDEALAVGDVKFQNKCYRKFNEFRDQGKTIIFVTHSTDLIAKLCNKAILLHDGHIIENNKPNLVINRYLELMLGSSNKNTRKEEILAETITHIQDPETTVTNFVSNQSKADLCLKNINYNKNEYRYGNGKGKIIDFLIISDRKINSYKLSSGSEIQIMIKFFFNETIELPVYGFTLKTVDGVEIFGSNSLIEELFVKQKQKNEFSIVKYIFPLNLKSGDYFISLGLAESYNGNIEALDRRYDLIHLKVSNSNSRYGIIDIDFHIEELAL